MHARRLRTRHQRDLEENGLQGLLDKITSTIGPHAPVYLTFDIDVLDPAIAPGTGTPEFGGMTPPQALTLLRGMDGGSRGCCACGCVCMRLRVHAVACACALASLRACALVRLRA